MTWFENGAGIVRRVIICDNGTLATEVTEVVCETSDTPVGTKIVSAGSMLSCSVVANVVMGFEEFERQLVDGVPAEITAVVWETSCAAVGADIVIAGSMLSGSEIATVVTGFEEFFRQLVDGVPEVTKEQVVL